MATDGFEELAKLSPAERFEQWSSNDSRRRKRDFSCEGPRVKGVFLLKLSFFVGFNKGSYWFFLCASSFFWI